MIPGQFTREAGWSMTGSGISDEVAAVRQVRYSGFPSRERRRLPWNTPVRMGAHLAHPDDIRDRNRPVRAAAARDAHPYLAATFAALVAIFAIALLAVLVNFAE